MSKLSGLASRIRGCTTDETFDLAGQDVSFLFADATLAEKTPTHNAFAPRTMAFQSASILQTITDAFAEPFKLDESVRLTFVV